MQILANWAVILAAGLGAICLAGCAATAKAAGEVRKAPFGKAPDGTPVDIYTLRNSKGVEARICTYGGIVVSLKVPDQNGKFGDVVLGYDTLDGYLKSSPYFGALVGRYGNRIAGGRFTLEGKTYTLATNNGPNALHGGIKGFDKVVWEAMQIASDRGPALELRYVSKDGEEGYPGNLKVTALYTLTDKNELRLDYTATTDKTTVLSLTHHSYFNLAGAGDVLNHEVMIAADKFTPVDANLIPTGELRPVKGTPLDFTKPMKIGARINSDDEQIKLGGGYDHNYVLKKPAGKLALAARVSEPTTGRVLEVFTTEPGMQFYTANFLDGSITGKGGWVYKKRHAFCMEPQHFPDSPNHPQFPSCVLKPGETYQNTIIYKFSVR
jgi:aldose 1-epimerase